MSGSARKKLPLAALTIVALAAAFGFWAGGGPAPEEVCLAGVCSLTAA